MPQTKHRVLIIDDDQDICEYLTEVARLLDHETRYITDTHMLEDALLFEPTLIILDLIMPNRDGIETLRVLSEKRITAGILLTSGFDKRVLKTASRLAEQLGLTVIGHLTKPVRTSELKQKLLDYTSTRPSTEIAKHNITEAQIAEALDKNQFVAYFQPKIHLSDMQVYSIEALARWHHPEYGIILPDEFIYLAEQTGQISQLTWIMLKQAFEFMQTLNSYPTSLSMSVNIPVSMIVDVDFTDRLVSEIMHYDIDPTRIIIEITESAVNRQIATSLDVLTRLRMKGTLLSIDDFGTGYSSLERLNNIPFTELKLDRSFIQDIDDDSSRKIIQKSIELAHELGIEVVAEGVETESVVETLRILGCDAAQGYFYAHPMPTEHFHRWFTTYHSDNSIKSTLNSAL